MRVGEVLAAAGAAADGGAAGDAKQEGGHPLEAEGRGAAGGAAEGQQLAAEERAQQACLVFFVGWGFTFGDLVSRPCLEFHLGV